MPEAATVWALAALACWRLTHLLWAEDGPWRGIARWRERLPRDAATGLPWLVGCFYCLSLWVAVPVTALAWLALPVPPAGTAQAVATAVLGWLGLSGAAISLERLLDRPTPPPQTTEETPP